MKLLLASLFFVGSVSASELTQAITFGGWSYHSDDVEKQKYPFNQVHNGLGYEQYYKRKQDNYSLGWGVWYMNDSYRKSAYHGAVTWRYHVSERFNVNLALSYMSRSKRTKQTITNWRGDDLTEYNIRRTGMIAIVPYLTINLVDNLDIDLMWMPNFQNDVSVSFARFNYRF